MTTREFIELLVILATAVNTFWITYKSYKELRPTLKKMEGDEEKTDAEIESEIAAAAETTAKGATVSSELLMQRIRELREDLENEKKARREDAAYFRRKFREAEKEIRDYRLWAAKLAKQVIEKGGIPVPFISSLEDSDPLLNAITKEQAELAKSKDKRIEELKNASPNEDKNS